MKISIIIPHRDRQKYAKLVIQQFLFNQKNSNSDIEIIVVDLGSKDDISMLSLDSRVKIIKVEYNGTFSRAWACNIGAKLSNYDILWFVDADAVPHPLLLNRVEEYFNIEDERFAINVPVLALNGQATNEVFQKGELSWQDYLKFKNALTKYSIKRQIDGTSQIILHKKMFFDLRGYDERFVGHGYEDMLLHDQIAKIIPDKWSPFPDKKEIKWSIERDLVLTHLYHGQRNYRSAYMKNYSKNLRLYKELVKTQTKNNPQRDWGVF